MYSLPYLRYWLKASYSVCAPATSLLVFESGISEALIGSCGGGFAGAALFCLVPWAGTAVASAVDLMTGGK